MNGKPGRFTLTNVYATGLLLVMLVWIANAWAFDPLFTRGCDEERRLAHLAGRLTESASSDPTRFHAARADAEC